jgi:uncharacterized membrane protein YgcG
MDKSKMARLEFDPLTATRLWLAAALFFFIYIVTLGIFVLVERSEKSDSFKSFLRTFTTGSFFLTVPTLIVGCIVYYNAELAIRDVPTTYTSPKLTSVNRNTTLGSTGWSGGSSGGGSSVGRSFGIGGDRYFGS